jgi:valyl-tRNA synthetase
MAKVRLRRGDRSPEPVLVEVLGSVLRLLHPFMPFVTEEIWQSLRELPGVKAGDALCIAPYPTGETVAHDAAAEREAEALMEIIRATRNLRAERKVDPARAIEGYIAVPDAALRVPLSQRAELIEALARLSPLRVVANPGEAPSDRVATAVLADATVILPLADLVDLDAERAKLEKELAETEAYIERMTGQIEKARGRAPEKVVAGMEENRAAARARLDGLQARLAELR